MGGEMKAVAGAGPWHRCRWVGGGRSRGGELMEIGWPTDGRHFAHLTLDRFHGFLGLPVEFEVELPPAFPSARYSLPSTDEISEAKASVVQKGFLVFSCCKKCQIKGEAAQEFLAARLMLRCENVAHFVITLCILNFLVSHVLHTHIRTYASEENGLLQAIFGLCACVQPFSSEMMVSYDLPSL
jgi:hypothetical protein